MLLVYKSLYVQPTLGGALLALKYGKGTEVTAFRLAQTGEAEPHPRAPQLPLLTCSRSPCAWATLNAQPQAPWPEGHRICLRSEQCQPCEGLRITWAATGCKKAAGNTGGDSAVLRLLATGRLVLRALMPRGLEV